MKRFLPFILLLFSIPAWAGGALIWVEPAATGGGGGGLAYVSYGTGTSSGTSLTISGMNYDAGDLVVVTLSWQDQGSTPTGVTDGTNTWTTGTPRAASGLEIHTWWCVIASTQSSATITVTFDSSMSGCYGTAAVFSGTYSASPVDLEVVGSTGTSASSSVTTGTLSQAVEVVFTTHHMYNNNPTCTADTADGFTLVSSVGNGTSKQCTQYKITDATTSLTADMALSPSSYNYEAGITFAGE